MAGTRQNPPWDRRRDCWAHPRLSDALLRGLPVGEAELEGRLVLFGMRGKPVIKKKRETVLDGICRR